MRDGGDELILQRVELGALCELKRVLVVLFASERELFREFAGRALRSQEREEQNAGRRKQGKITKYGKNVHFVCRQPMVTIWDSNW